ncbi:MAG: transglutaminase family protein [Methylophilaceae bacterium]|nr:transglutaminase family protein [Methylophilaceae bacterium]
MKLNIEHRTRYQFDAPLSYTIQQLRLTPQDGFGQRVKNWNLKVSGRAASHTDAYGNTAHTLVMDTPHQEITITASGEVETDVDLPAIFNGLALPVYLRHTPLTQANTDIRQLAHHFLPAGKVVDKAMLIALMKNIHQRLFWIKETKTAPRSAIETLSIGSGASHDMAHLFIASCRALKVPARFVHGYYFNQAENKLINHSWADAWLVGESWQSFDIANNCLSNGVHVRLATGLDYRDACPISNVMRDPEHEQLSVDFIVRKVGMQEMMQQ